MNRSKIFVGALALIVSAGCTEEVQQESSNVSEAAVTTSSRCPAGNGFYVLYYGSNPDDFAQIRAAKPNFVVLGDGLEGRADLPVFFAQNGVRTFAYLPTGKGTNFLDDRIKTTIKSGFDGVFFDEANPTANMYNAGISKLLHDAGKTVIMNPGVAAVGADIFNYADIVSTENKWNSTLSPTGVDAWRWLSVQGDPGKSVVPDDQPPMNGADALARLQTYRSAHGGFWYYSSAIHATTVLPPWFDSFASSVRALGAAPCASAPPPPPPTSGSAGSAGSGAYTLGVHAFNKANNAELTGLYTTVQTTGGSVLLSGFTPMNFNLPAGTYQITEADYKGPTSSYAFDHWDDHSTTQPRTVTLTTSPSGLWTGGWYTVTP